jgi:hypothetical protein
MGKAGFGMASQMDLHRFLFLAEQVSFQSRIRASTNFRNYGRMEKMAKVRDYGQHLGLSGPRAQCLVIYQQSGCTSK